MQQIRTILTQTKEVGYVLSIIRYYSIQHNQGQILLILLSVRWFNNIKLNYNNIISTSKDSSNTYIKAKDEVALLYQKIIELITLTTKQEQLRRDAYMHRNDT